MCKLKRSVYVDKATSMDIKSGKNTPKLNVLRPNRPRRQQVGIDIATNNGIVDQSAHRAAMSSPVIPAIPGRASKEIKYVVFITKENHTFDAIFDRIPGARHDPSLLRWGLRQNVEEKGQPTLKDVPVMPGSLEESLNALEKDHEFLLRGDVFTKDAIHEWLDYKRTKELNPIRMRPTPHEFFLYYDI